MKWVNQGENIALLRLLQSTEAPANLYLGLYVNSVEPAEDAVLSSLTEISSGVSGGYARIALPKNDWTVVADVSSQPQKTFTALENWGNVYGYFICDAATGTSGNLYGVETFADAPYNVLNGGSIKITTRLICS